MTLKDIAYTNITITELEALRAEIERLRTELDEAKEIGNGLIIEAIAKGVEIERLKEQVATCRELRKYDRIEIERMRILLDRKTP